MSSDPELKNAILKLTNLIATQQEQIAALQLANANPSGSEKISLTEIICVVVVPVTAGTVVASSKAA
ncbi:hypothetical protein pipiens_009306 [Culex pipiens pipiens]|uniref:Uncharacterized protein n=1 Tax=Culex pipiens pipiens TaxID=38569 RepID=A0ABD1DEZ8_CULPP